MNARDVDWEAVGTIVALLGVLISFVFNILSNRTTRAGQQEQRALAQAAAARAEEATRVSHGYTEQIVDALERIAVSGARRAKVRWELVHHAGDTYRLTNRGDAQASDVHVSAHETLGLGKVGGGPDLGPGEALTLMAAPSMATRDSTVTVDWMNSETSERERWRFPLPAN